MDGIGQIFWLFLIIAALAPMVQQRLLLYARVQIMQRLQRKRGSHVITLIHRQESMSFLGFPVMRYIDIEDSELVLQAIYQTPKDKPIDLVLHTPGGLVLASSQIARALVRHLGKVTVFVPHYAMSGGTLIALAADEIVLDHSAVLGPVDPQLGEYPAASILAAARTDNPNRDDRTLILADIAAKAVLQVEDMVFEVVRKHMDEQRAREVAKAMTDGRFTHDYPLTAEQLQAYGLPVTTGIPQELHHLMRLYRQAGRRRPGVEYVPMPYGAGHPDDATPRR
jgi:ClpP class serine protease